MRIGVNARFLLKNKLEGFGVFTKECFEKIVKFHPKHEFFFFFDRPYSSDFIFSSNVTPIVLYPQARHPFLYIIWFEFSIYRALKKHKIDTFISPDGFLSLRSKIPQFAIIHDVNFEVFPQHFPFLTRTYYQYFFPKFAKKAISIFTVSNFSKQEICKYYNIKKEKIKVIYNGVSSQFSTLTDQQKKNVLKEYSNNNPYFIYIGALQPRKNIARMIMAFDLFKKTDTKNMKFIIVGEKKWWSKHSQKTFLSLKYKDHILFIGRKNNEELIQLLGSAIALVYVSLYEGFGIPIIEAAKVGTPVITSNTSSMKEIGKSMCMLVNPNNVDEIANSMIQISTDENIRNSFIEKGKQEILKFTWTNTANNLWNHFISIMNNA